ncbi:MAG TPA: ABC transporter substrate-binding protein, partial [Bacillota bacterium]|nr:ABC transporter substrate-binding protein [Bacillota bacterium]
MKIGNKTLIVLSAFAIIIAVMSGTLKDAARGSYDTEKRLIVGRANDSVTLDPSCTVEMDSFKVTVNILETLVKCENGGNEVVPLLAESWESSEDGLKWVFKLRRGVKFHDGTAFDADAVVLNFNRWMYEDNPYHKGSFNYWNYIFGGFPGLVKSITALNNYSVEIKLNKPFAPFLYAMTMPAFGIASPEAIKKHQGDLSEHPVGTGPFVYRSWERNKSIILERNDKYWNDAAKVERVEFKVIPGNKDRLEELRQGTIHIADYL